MSEQKCSETVHGPHYWRGRTCARNATVERGGRHYCTIHDPENVKRRQAVNRARWKRESEIRQAGYDIDGIRIEVVELARKAAKQEASIDDLFAAVDRLEQAEAKKRALEAGDV